MVERSSRGEAGISSCPGPSEEVMGPYRTSAKPLARTPWTYRLMRWLIPACQHEYVIPETISGGGFPGDPFFWTERGYRCCFCSKFISIGELDENL